MHNLKECLLLVVIATFLGACTLGYKDWPKPQHSQDTFGWHSVTAQMAGTSLVIEGRMNGQFENFQYVRLLVEPLGPDACQGCPFSPNIAREYRPGDAGFELMGPWMKLQLNGVDTSIPYRFQLVGTNRLIGLKSVKSNIERIDP